MDLSHGIALIEQLGDGAGFHIDLKSADRALIDNGGTQHSYDVKFRSAPPAPSVVTRDLERHSHRPGNVHLLYVVPHLTASLRATALSDHRVAVAATGDATVILDGTEWQRELPTPPAPAARGRRPWGRFALMRALIRSDVPRSQAVLAAEAGIAQQAVALALPKLAALGVARDTSGWTTTEPGTLWDAFMAEYPGAGGLRRRWTGAAPLDVQLDRAVNIARGSGTSLLLSGDLAADQQAPMRRPVTATVFASADIDLSSRSTLVGDGDETLTVVVPADRTVFTTARAWHGADRDDAVAHLKLTVLTKRAQQAPPVTP